MNREIKFRAWDIKGKRMLTPTLVNVKNKTFTAIVEKMNKGNWNGNYRFDEVYFMQFTGLHDKNGVGIYEGDFVKRITSIGYEFEGEVIYKEYGFGINGLLDFMPLTKKGKNDDGRSSFSYTIEYEILGNVYENPELLKQKDGN